MQTLFVDLILAAVVVAVFLIALRRRKTGWGKGSPGSVSLAEFFNLFWGWADYTPKDWSNAPYKREHSARRASLAFSVSPTRSDQYPTLNVAPVCHGIVEQSDLEAGLRQTNFDQCLQAEQADRETMIKEWTQFSADDRRHCIAETTMGGESSYTELLTCLEMARDVRELHKQPNSLSEQNIPPAPVGHRQPTQ